MIGLGSHLRIARAPVAAFAAMGVLWGAYAAVLPDIKAQLGVDEARLGLLMLSTPIAAVVAMLLAPAFGAGLGRAALPVASLLMAMAFIAPGQVQVAWLFPVAMLAAGAATGLTDVLMNARTAALETGRGLHLMNLCHAAYSFGYAAGAIGTGAMRDAGLPPGPVLLAAAALSGALGLLTIERDGAIDGLARRAGAGGMGLVPLIGGGVVLIAFLTENAAENWSALHIEKTLGGSPAAGAMGPAVLALTMGFARIGGQGLVRHLNPFRLLALAALVASTGAAVAGLAVVPAMAYAGFIIMGIGASVIVPTAFSLVGQLAPAEARARAVARATLFGYFGYFIGPPMLGALAGGFGLRVAFLWAALILLAVPLLARLMARAAR